MHGRPQVTKGSGVQSRAASFKERKPLARTNGERQEPNTLKHYDLIESTFLDKGYRIC